MCRVFSFSPYKWHLTLCCICYNNESCFIKRLLHHTNQDMWATLNAAKWPRINSDKGRRSLRKGHRTEKEKNMWSLFTPVTTSSTHFQSTFMTKMILPQWQRVNEKSNGFTPHTPIKEMLWPAMKTQARQLEVWLITYRMSEKWVTRVGGLCLSHKKTQGFKLATVNIRTGTPQELMGS